MVQSSRFLMCVPFVFLIVSLFVGWLVGLFVYLFCVCSFVRGAVGPAKTFRFAMEANPGMISKSLGSRVFRF